MSPSIKLFNLFISNLEKLLQPVRDTKLVALLEKFPAFSVTITGCLVSMPDKNSFEITKDLTSRIKELLFHALHIADRVLKEHFYGDK